MVVYKSFCTKKLRLALNIDLLVRHPLALLIRPAFDLSSPSLECIWVDKPVVFHPEEEKAILLELSELLR